MFGVRSVKVGEVEVPGPELFWMSAWDVWYPLFFQVVLIQGQGVTALVNTGPPSDLNPINVLWRQQLGSRAELRRAPEEEIVPALSAVGVRPEDVTHIILTPFQLYTTGNVPLFTNAEICVSKKGWIHYHTTHDHPHDARWNSSPSTFSFTWSPTHGHGCVFSRTKTSSCRGCVPGGPEATTGPRSRWRLNQSMAPS